MAKKRRKRKRRQAPPQRTEAATAADRPRAAASARRADGPPPPLWGSFPLSELVVLIALVMFVASFFVGPPRGPIMFGTSLVLGSLAGLELSAREHFAGYRSHTLLLSAAAGMLVFGGLAVSNTIGPLPSLAAGVAVGAVAAWGLATAFRRRSGGALFKAR